MEHLYNFLDEKLFWSSTRDHSSNYEVIPVSNSKSQWSLHLLLRNGVRHRPACFLYHTDSKVRLLELQKATRVAWYPLFDILAQRAQWSKYIAACECSWDSNCSKVNVGMERRGKWILCYTLLYWAIWSWDIVIFENNAISLVSDLQKGDIITSPH